MRDRETARLRLRRWHAEDLEPYTRINADPEVMRFIAGGMPKTPEECAADLAYVEDHWERHGFGLWAAELKSSGELIGFVGLSEPTFIPELIGTVEVGWRLGREHWNQGLATEGARAALDAGFSELDLAEIVSVIDPDNRASVRVAEKLGMTYGGPVRHPLGFAVGVYRLSAPLGSG
jgi:RimJ/RimL family protein N-acetyltransferase